MWARENPYSGIFYAVPLISVFVIFPSNVCTCSKKKCVLRTRKEQQVGFSTQNCSKNSQILKYCTKYIANADAVAKIIQISEALK